MDTLTPNPANIIAVYERATAEQLTSGLNWYGRAHALAHELSPHDTGTAAGVIAALSPMLSWTRNIVLAREAFAAGHLAGGCLGSNVVKANRILDGEHPLDVLGGDKVRSFYKNIADPMSHETVTIDRHAYDVALDTRNTENSRPALSGKRYVAYAAAYREAAETVGLVPCQIQAVTWEVWRETWAWRKTAATA